ncbi:MAG: type I DNA topoisomerase, partial [Planctomycetes bacterium]|nr:type I DNA topoisomerase [Planctomycetota bacterium]
FVSCQMTPAVWKVTEVDVVPEGVDAALRAMGRQLAFDGFLKVAGLPRGGSQVLPDLAEGSPVAPIALGPTQHFTQPPPRFTEASLVKSLEADGIGRPSTYAAIIQTIQDREYVRQVDRSFHPTDLGLVVTDKLVKAFPKLFDVRFTAHMEDELDKVEEARAEWVEVLEEFYKPFVERLERAAEEMVHAKAETAPSDYVCESCGRPMVYRFSRNGRYLACTGYPECKTTHPVDRDGKKIEQVTVDVSCPKCGSAMTLRRGRFGPFLSCPRYPACDGVLNLDRKGFVKLPSAPPLAVDLTCPRCQSPLYLRRGRRGPWLSCSTYPKCRGRVGWKTLPEDRQKQLELLLMNHEKANPVPVVRTLDGKPLGEQYKPGASETPPAPADPPRSEEDAV